MTTGVQRKCVFSQQNCIAVLTEFIIIMKNGKNQINAFIVIGAFLVLIAGVIVLYCIGEGNEITYHDLGLYTSGKYLTDEFEEDDAVRYAYKSASVCLPAPDDMEADLDYDFFIFNGKANLTNYAVTVALDVIYSDETRYTADKQKILGAYTYLTEYDGKYSDSSQAEFSATVGNFACQIVNAETYKNYPEEFLIFCYSDSDLTLRYYFYYALEPYMSPKSIAYYVKDCGTCSW